MPGVRLTGGSQKSGAFAIPWQDFPLHLLAAIPAVCTAFSFAGSPYENARITFAGPNTCQSCLKNWAGIRDFRSGGYFKCRAWNRTVVVERPTAAGELAHTGPIPRPRDGAAAVQTSGDTRAAGGSGRR